MASGMPFSDREKKYIRDMMNLKSPGMIAQELAVEYSADNGGYRSWRSVRRFIYRERHDTETPITVFVPRKLIRDARDAGVLDEVISVARAAILVRYGDGV